MSFEDMFGWIAFFTSVIGLLPQCYKAFRTRSTADVSMSMLINYLACSAAWVFYAVCIHSMFVFWSNLFCSISSLALIIQKLYYDKLNHAY